MKTMRKIILLTAMLLTAGMAGAQVRVGVKAGVMVNSLHLTREIGKDLFSSDNRVGFTGGLMLDIKLPVVGLGLEGDVLYSHRSSVIDEYSSSLSRDYITIPVNLKYRLSLPVIGKWVTPFVTTGPDFAFQILKKEDSSLPGVDTNTMTCSWNVGFGVEIMSRVQVHANYGLGLTSALKFDKSLFDGSATGKDRYWTVTAAYMF